MLIVENPDFVWGLIGSMYLGNLMLVLMSVVAIPLFIKFLDVPYRLVVPVIVTLCVVGTFALHSSMIETWILLATGLLGFGMKRFGYSPAATVLAVVLGGMAENAFLQSLLIGDGSLRIFITRPISLALTAVVVAIFAAAALVRLRALRR